jgi:membrane protease YdiL (CAAX protease family)
VRENFGPVEPLFILATIGIGFSALAWWATRGLTPRQAAVRSPREEGVATLGGLLALAAFITWGLPAVRGLAAPGWPSEILVLGAKVLVFVALPLLLWTRRFGYSLPQLFDIRSGLRGHWRPTIVMAGAITLFQAVFGRARHELVGLDPAPGTAAVTLAVAFAWLMLDVGLVEELPFRGLVQTRLSAWARSEAFGLVAMALAFGLAHAPGFYLRPELMGEALGATPTIIRAVGYSVVVTSVAGLFYGVLWLRTRNLWVVVWVHAAQDLLPTVAEALRRGYLGA